jgi:hypothetical protein
MAEEYSLKDMDKIIDNDLLPFFMQDLIDKKKKDYLAVVVKCIERCDIFKNAIFETLQISFVFSADDPYILGKLEEISSPEKEIESIFSAAFANFDTSPPAPSSLMTFSNPLLAAGAQVAIQQKLEIGSKGPDDTSFVSFINEKFYSKIKSKLENNKSVQLQKADFARLNALCFYFILNLMADCLYIQVTIVATGVVILLNANSDKPVLMQDIIDVILEKNIADFEKAIDDFFKSKNSATNLQVRQSNSNIGRF